MKKLSKTDQSVINNHITMLKYGLREEGIDLPEKVDLCVVDLSYISLKLVIKPIIDLMKNDACCV